VTIFSSVFDEGQTESLRALLEQVAAALLPGSALAIERGDTSFPIPNRSPSLTLPLRAWGHTVGRVQVERPDHRHVSRSAQARLEQFVRLAASVLLGATVARPQDPTQSPFWGHAPDRRDPITGLPKPPSLEAFVERTRHERPCDRMALLLAMPDRLSSFREEVGDPLANAGLTLVARAVRGTLRSSDRVVRLEGDWIAALLPAIRRSDALRVAETVRAAVAEAGMTSSTPWPLTASIGVVTSPEDASEAKDLCMAAHRAVARSVARGGNCVAGLAAPAAPQG
jgi:diguanylate cyclase (GGDEF)-like protein